MKAKIVVAGLIGIGVALIGLGYWSVYGRLVQGSGVEFIEERSLEAIHRIDLSCAANLEVLAGESQKVVVTGDDNLVPLIETQVSNGRLVVRCAKHYRSKLGVRVQVTLPKLEELDLSGSGNVAIGKFEGDRFVAMISGSGDLRMTSFVGHTCEARISGSGNIDLTEFSGETLMAGISGSGNVAVRGDASQLEAKVSGSGNLNLDKILVRQAVAKISGSGNIKVNALESLEAGISGSGNITQLGKAKPMAKVSGSGRVNQK